MNPIFHQADLYIVDFDPSVGHEFKKQRPAIIIQSNPALTQSNLITILALTSQIANKKENDLLIQKDEQNNLFCDSIIKVQSIHSFDKSRFIKKIGVVSNNTFSQIKKYLYQHFDLKP